MKLKIYAILICILSLSMVGCSKSPLSEIELNDPSVLKVSVHIAQNEYNDKEVQVFIRDKNGRPVKLLDGWVDVNRSEAKWDRASINSLNERGYIYYPFRNEHEFLVEIHLNGEDTYWFRIDPESGFPGFVHDYPIEPGEYMEGEDPYLTHTYYIRNRYFRHEEIKVSYHILRR